MDVKQVITIGRRLQQVHGAFTADQVIRALGVLSSDLGQGAPIPTSADADGVLRSMMFSGDLTVETVRGTVYYRFTDKYLTAYPDIPQLEDQPSELAVDEELYRRLSSAANQAKVMNWSPYSKFPVLAAVETIDGRIYGGSNVENANFSLTKHAEESAVLAALADGALVRCGREWLKTIYIEAPTDCAPCGSCRQFINEFAAEDAIWVKHNNVNGETYSLPFRELLPFDFGPRHLDVD